MSRCTVSIFHQPRLWKSLHLGLISSVVEQFATYKYRWPKPYKVNGERMGAAILMKPSTIPQKGALTYSLQVKQRCQHTLLSCGLQQGGNNTMQHNATQNTCSVVCLPSCWGRTYHHVYPVDPFTGVTGESKLAAAIPLVWTQCIMCKHRHGNL